MAELLHPVEYAFLKSLMLKSPFDTYHDDFCDMRLDSEVPGSSYFNRILEVEFCSGVPSDITQPGGGIQTEAITCLRVDTNTIVNENSFVLAGGGDDVSSVILRASGTPVAYGTVKRPKMLKFGQYTVMPGDVQFKVNGIVSAAFLESFIDNVFLQVTPPPLAYTPPLGGIPYVYLGLYQGEPNDFTNAQPIATIAVPSFTYSPPGFYNSNVVIFSGSLGGWLLAGEWMATHVALCWYWQQLEGPGTPTVWGFYIAGPLTRPIPYNSKMVVRFEPGDLRFQMT